jgi:fimbrial isopeptide formation D2 family protein/LPXTG-motif cell wall-anchored protein
MSEPGVDKEAELDEGTSYDKTWTSTRIGEVVHYTVTATIPGYGEVMQNPVYKAKEKLTYLKLVGEPTVVGLTKDNEYKITAGGNANDDNYTIEFQPSYLKGLNVPTKVTIKYDAVVTTDAPLNVNEELNEVWVEYNHNPQEEGDYNVKKDETAHYTYSIDANLLGGYEEGVKYSGYEIVKVGLDEKDRPIYSDRYWETDLKKTKYEGALEGAQFKLYSADKQTLAQSSEYATVKNETFDIWSDANGRLYTKHTDGSITPGIVGLDAGTYYLEEVKAPAGYIRDTGIRKIEIIPTLTPKDFTEYWDGTNWHKADEANINPAWKSATFRMETLDSYVVKVDGNVAATHTFYNPGVNTYTMKSSSDGVVEQPHNFVNKKGVELPSTGGMGTTLFYAIGAVLVLGAGILLVSKRRMSAY